MRLLLVLLVLLPRPAEGWSALTHRVIAAKAARALGGELGARLLAHERELLRGAVAPDRRGPGHIPSEDHVWHPVAAPDGTHFGHGPERAAKMAWALVNKPPDSDAALVFELGCICHLVSDLCQPLHTDGGPAHPLEHRYHSHYEHDVDRALSWWTLPVHSDLAPAPDIREHLRALATSAHSSYGALERAYLGGHGFADVEPESEFRVALSIEATVAVWRGLGLDGQRRLPPGGGRLVIYAEILGGYLALVRPRRAWLRRTGPSLREVFRANCWFQLPRVMISMIPKMMAAPQASTSRNTMTRESTGRLVYGAKAVARSCISSSRGRTGSRGAPRAASRLSRRSRGEFPVEGVGP